MIRAKSKAIGRLSPICLIKGFMVANCRPHPTDRDGNQRANSSSLSGDSSVSLIDHVKGRL